MNIDKLKQGEAAFFEQYPGGFDHPEMQEIAKKHRMEKLIERAQEVFQSDKFENYDQMSEVIIKTVTSSSMVSVFEKPKFRDFIRSLGAKERGNLSRLMYQMLYGDMEKGFNDLVEFLLPAKLAKWTLVTVCPAYFRPHDEIFIKPTTAKTVIQYFEITDLTYKPRPSWEFYSRYREYIHMMKREVSSLLSPDNAAFSGFLMMTMGLF